MKLMSMMKGALFGAAVMYLFDPDQGPQRRAMLGNRLQGVKDSKRRALRLMTQDFSNRARGAIYESKAILRDDHPDDDTLVGRVRSSLGRLVAHVGAIDVEAKDGAVTLGGDALASEIASIVRCVRMTRGVTRVENRLTVHEGPAGVSSLQGGREALGRKGMTPAQDMVIGVAGGLLTLYGLGRRGLIGKFAGLAGASLLTRSFQDAEGMPWGGLLGGTDSEAPEKEASKAPRSNGTASTARRTSATRKKSEPSAK